MPCSSPNPAHAGSTSPGKNSAFESSDFGGSGDIPAGNNALLVASLVKGKKKHVLAIEAMLSSGPSPVASYLVMNVEVNGVVFAEPAASEILQNCGGAPCTLTGTWWLDLDAAELAHPGVFIKQPLTVTLHGGEGFASPQASGEVTMSVRLQKK